MDEIYVTKDNVFPISLEQLLKENPTQFKNVNFKAKGTVIGGYNSTPQEALIELSEKLPKEMLVCNVEIKTRNHSQHGIGGFNYHESYVAMGMGYSKIKYGEGFLQKHSP